MRKSGGMSNTKLNQPVIAHLKLYSLNLELINRALLGCNIIARIAAWVDWILIAKESKDNLIQMIIFLHGN